MKALHKSLFCKIGICADVSVRLRLPLDFRARLPQQPVGAQRFGLLRIALLRAPDLCKDFPPHRGVFLQSQYGKQLLRKRTVFRRAGRLCFQFFKKPRGSADAMLSGKAFERIERLLSARGSCEAIGRGKLPKQRKLFFFRRIAAVAG